jgi:N utilization substance protein A
MVIVDEDNKSLLVVVPDDQLSLAIGRQGQNVRLASKLLGWRIDVKSESRYAKLEEAGYRSLLEIPGVNEALADKLYDKSITSAADLAAAQPEEIDIPGLEPEQAAQLVAEAQQYDNSTPDNDDGQAGREETAVDQKAGGGNDTVKIYELAKEADVKSKELADRLIDLGYDIKGLNSSVDSETADKIRKEVLGL